MKITEEDLIKDRNKRIQKFKCWLPDSEEFRAYVRKVWISVLDGKKDRVKLYTEIPVEVVFSAMYKQYVGMEYIFARYYGPPEYEKCLIEVYRTDILTVNLWQRDLVERHLFFILEHELEHHLGNRPKGDAVVPKKVSNYVA
jgi:hypothetical protein